MRDEGTLDEIESLWFRSSKPEEELFDCLSDPEELNNLAGDPQYADILSEMRAECDRWIKEVDDKGFMDEHEMVKQFWPGKIQPVTKDPSLHEEAEQIIALSTDEAGSYLGYQLLVEGDTLSSHWEIYTGPVKLTDHQELYAIAHRKGYLPSQVVKWD